jgi:uncharacterized protein (DUF1501 family)
MKRRDFLKASALASASLLTPRFLHHLSQQGISAQGKRLIVLQLSGGNDGLNTFVPFRNDIYYRERPGLALQEVLPLNDELGLNPALAPLQGLFDQGQLCLINNVGYPNPNRSHFRSMDIWHSASDSDAYLQSGWLGRYLDHSCPGCAKPHQVVEVSDSLSLAVKGTQHTGLAVRDLKQMRKATQDPYLRALAQPTQQDPTSPAQLGFLYKTLTETLESADYLYESARVQRSQTRFPAHPFGRNLKMIAELIAAGVETQVFYASLSGFDTHVRQRGQQERLLGIYAEGLAALVKDLKASHRLQDTLILTFSEFGRRVAENASGGTDHGKANPVWLVGGSLEKAGIYNEAPGLSQLDAGDVPWKIDFRQIYATILDRWLGADARKVLGRDFEQLEVI